MAMAQDKPAYQLFDRQGKPATYQQLEQAIRSADVILFGELHNNPICHWLQLQVTYSLHEARPQALVMGAEMFEADNQLVLQEYLQGMITEQALKQEAKVWNNYDTDYAPLLNYARKHQIPFIATNIPRRYASMVSRQGLAHLETLPQEARNYIAELPIALDLELPSYKNMLGMVQGHGHGGGMKPENFAAAQAIKDATMAHFILKNWSEGKQFLHFHGTYHSNNDEGIAWYLKKKAPSLKIITIASVEQKDIAKLDEASNGLGAFIICIPSDMTKTYISRFE
jgi:uncharacterized iron-regulated protein